MKNRKNLYFVLGIVIVCIFTLTVAYSALNVVLTISGNAKVNSADWVIYLNNPRVTNGSATTNVPVIKTSSTLEFETTLNMPGDFYEFTVDVVNGGSIDAMIENVVKTPELTTDQAKFLKYEVSYANGESISEKQNIGVGVTMPIKVRIEYRNDLNNSDLPTGQVVLDLALTIEYIQSDGTGNDVLDNGQVSLDPSGDVNSGINLIEFTIGGDTFYAEEGMTWWDWSKSAYNIDGDVYYVTQLGCMYSNKYGRIVTPEGYQTSSGRVIKAGEAYNNY